jgi:hypothetical protein
MLADSKICPSCKTAKTITSFYRCKRYKDGLQIYCIECLNTKKRDTTKIWKKKNRDHINAYNKKPEVLEKRRIRTREYARKRRKNPSVRALESLRSRVNVALKQAIKSEKTMTLVGCSMDEFRKHLESLFQPGMTWENYGKKGWHIDHIKPCASFNLMDPEQQKACFHWSNCQPLWARDNMRKGSRMPD